MSNRFSRHVLLTLIVQMLLVATALGTASVTARWLGTDGRGILSLALLIPAMASIFLSLGLGSSNVYLVGTGRIGLQELVSNSAMLTLLGTAAGALLLGILSMFGWFSSLAPGVPLWAIWLAAATLPLSLLAGMLSALLLGRQQIGRFNAVNLGRGVSRLLLTLAFVPIHDFELAGSILAAVLAELLSLSALAVMLHRDGAKLIPRWQSHVLSRTLRYGLRGHVGNVLQFFNYRLDAFVVNSLLGVSAVGLYGAAVGSAEVLWHLPNSVGFVIFPRSSSSSEEEMNVLTPKVLRWTMGLSAAGAVCLALAGKWLLGLIYGQSFVAAYPSLLALLPGVVLLSGSKVLSGDLAGRGHIGYNSISSGLGLLVTIGLNILLIPSWGILGAAVASSTSYLVVLSSTSFFYSRVSGARRGQ